jgi:hypothetical protein
MRKLTGDMIFVEAFRFCCELVIDSEYIER